MPRSDAGALFHEGRLTDAIEAAGAAVRAAPADAGPRMLLAELLLFAGNLERADAVLNATAAADPGMAVVVAEFRQLLRAAQVRHQVLFDGRAPEFLGEPTPSQAHLLQALDPTRRQIEHAALLWRGLRRRALHLDYRGTQGARRNHQSALPRQQRHFGALPLFYRRSRQPVHQRQSPGFRHREKIPCHGGCD